MERNECSYVVTDYLYENVWMFTSEIYIRLYITINVNMKMFYHLSLVGLSSINLSIIMCINLSFLSYQVKSFDWIF